MKNNKGLTLVELIIVLACLGMVTLFFWSILGSSSEDAYTLTDKMMVQNSVTSLMNTIQKDVQEAKIVITKVKDDKPINGILVTQVEEDTLYIFNTVCLSSEDEEEEIIYNDNTIEYKFNEEERTVTRKQGKSENAMVSKYTDIVSFSMEYPGANTLNENTYGVKVSIVGGKIDIGEGHDRSRYDLDSTFYTRNTQ